MVDIKLWMKHFTELLKETFGDRIYFVGLQGSYGRGGSWGVWQDVSV